MARIKQTEGNRKKTLGRKGTQKVTSIGRKAKITNKHKKRQRKRNRGQG